MLTPSTPASLYADAIARARASATSPFWPFGALTPQQQRERAAQQRAMCSARLAQYPQGLL